MQSLTKQWLKILWPIDYSLIIGNQWLINWLPIDYLLIFLSYLQLKECDARGNTPFMTAVQCRNFKAAIYILDFVESNKGIAQLYAIIFRFHLKKTDIGRNSDSLCVCCL